MTLSYGLIDVVNNAFGLKTARRLVLAAAAVRGVIWILVGAVLVLPTFSSVPGFDRFMGNAFRLTLAGEVSILVGQYFIDTKIFDWVKNKLRAPFWVRYNVSNLVSYTVGHVVFIFIGFVGTGAPMWSIIFGSIVWRYIGSVALTPLFSLLSRWATRAGAAAIILLFAFNVQAFELAPIEGVNTTRFMMSENVYSAHIDNILFLQNKDTNLWVLDLFTWDRTAAAKLPMNVFNNRLIIAWTPLWCLGPEIEWQQITNVDAIFRGGLACRLNGTVEGFRIISNTTAGVSTGDYRYSTGEYFDVKHVNTGLFANDIFVWWFGNGNYRVNNKLTVGWEFIDHLAIVGQYQVTTGMADAWRWGIQGSF